MIVIDASALLAVLKKERDWETYARFMGTCEGPLCMSTPGFVEASISAERRLVGRGGANLMREYCKTLFIEVRPFSKSHMAWALEGFDRFGKGRGEEPAALNFGDCLTYGFAMGEKARILFKGDDFTKTDAELVQLA